MVKIKFNYLPSKFVPPDVTIRVFCLSILLSLINLILRYQVPTTAGGNTTFDDLLGVRLASHILNGDWLGPWSNLTLAKPSGYSIYLAIIHYVPIEVSLITQIFVILSSFYFATSLIKFVKSLHLKNFIFIFSIVYLIFNPNFFGHDFSRVYRTSLNCIFVILISSTFLRIIYLLDEDSFLQANSKSNKHSLTRQGIYFGLAASGLFLTRSDSFWLTSALIVTFAAYVFVKTFKLKGNKNSQLFVSRSAFLLLIGFLSYILPISLIGQINNTYYGTSLTENYFSGNFAKAVKLWEGVVDGADNRPGVWISKGQREAVYSISVTANLLRPFLETPPNTGWKMASCQSAAKICDESGNWFMWDLRDAAVSAGNIKSEASFQEFFRAISEDISNACRDGKLQCQRPGLSAGAPPLSRLSMKQILDGAVQTFASIINQLPGANIEHTLESDDPSIVAEWHSVVNFREVVIPNSNFYWMGMGQTLILINQIYVFLGLILLLITIIFALYKIATNLDLWFFLVYGNLLAFVLFCIGIGIFGASQGFTPGYGLYSLPGAQTYALLMLISLAGFLDNSKSAVDRIIK